jgi:hypothetical protein
MTGLYDNGRNERPVKIRVYLKTIRPLGKENDKAFALINALDAAQKKEAILNYQIADRVLGPGHHANRRSFLRTQRILTRIESGNTVGACRLPRK